MSKKVLKGDLLYLLLGKVWVEFSSRLFFLGKSWDKVSNNFKDFPLFSIHNIYLGDKI